MRVVHWQMVATSPYATAWAMAPNSSSPPILMMVSADPGESGRYGPPSAGWLVQMWRGGGSISWMDRVGDKGTYWTEGVGEGAS